MKRRARLACCGVAAFVFLFARPVLAEDPCLPIDMRFKALIARYVAAADKAISDVGDVGEALEAARKAAMAGDAHATITMAGVALVMRPHAEMFNLAAIRQICGFAERNSLPLHIVTCTYFAALNPIGSREDKRKLVEQGFTRFKALSADAPGRDEALNAAITSLETCLATRPE